MPVASLLPRDMLDFVLVTQPKGSGTGSRGPAGAGAAARHAGAAQMRGRP